MPEESFEFVDGNSAWPTNDQDLLALGDNPYTHFMYEWQRGRGLTSRLMGYRTAATILAQQVISQGANADLDTVFFPYAATWRHYVELQLKALVVTYRFLTDKAEKPPIGHQITPLWQELREMLEEVGHNVDDEASMACGKLLAQLQELDPSSQAFRYDTLQGGKATLPNVDRIDYVNFQECMEALANFLTAVADDGGARLDSKLEMMAERDELRAEYEAEMRGFYE